MNQIEKVGGTKTVHVIQGKLYATDDPTVVLTTVLGSCVSTCLHDPEAMVGGMNHFLLPGDLSGATLGESYGVHAMELLMNDLYKLGAQRERLVAKVFGAANMLGSSSPVGIKNAKFIREFLGNEGIPTAAESLGGNQARRIQFWPVEGNARQKLMESAPTNLVEVAPPKPAPAPSAEIELF